MMIDTHAHINFEELSSNIETILHNAQKKGVEKIIAIGVDLESSIKAIELAKTYSNIYATVGIHPGYVDDSNHLDLDSLYNNKKVIAVGEIGLDFYWRSDNKEIQIKIFEEQIKKAIKLNLPVIIHTRNSFFESYEIVKKYKGKVYGVFHCFSGTYEDALKAIDLGFYIGIDGPITFKNKNEELIKIVKNIDLKHILIETDSPYMSPEPFRGRKNEPSNLYYIAGKIAQIKKVPLDEVTKITTNNAKMLFRIEV